MYMTAKGGQEAQDQDMTHAGIELELLAYVTACVLNACPLMFGLIFIILNVVLL